MEGPIQRLARLEAELVSLRQRLDALEASQTTPKQESKPKAKPRQYLQAFTPEAKSVVLFAWELLLEDRKPGEKVLLQALQVKVAELDTEGCVPSLYGYSDTVRGIIAESVGLNVVWSKQQVAGRKRKNGDSHPTFEELLAEGDTDDE